MKDIAIRLSENQLLESEKIARIRWNGKEKLASTRNYIGALTSLDGHIIGALGEIAFAQWAELSVDCKALSAGDAGIDFVLSGVSIDVQTAKYDPAYLKYDPKHPLKAAVAVLACVRHDTRGVAELVNLVGWITVQEFEKKKRPRNFGHGLRDSVGPDEMNCLSGLHKYCASLKGK